MRRFSRRQFAGSVGAGLLLAPFINVATRRTAQAAVKQSKRVLLFCERLCSSISHTRFEAPMTLVGFTALSVEMSTNLLTP